MTSLIEFSKALSSLELNIRKSQNRNKRKLNKTCHKKVGTPRLHTAFINNRKNTLLLKIIQISNSKIVFREMTKKY